MCNKVVQQHTRMAICHTMLGVHQHHACRKRVPHNAHFLPLRYSYSPPLSGEEAAKISTPAKRGSMMWPQARTSLGGVHSKNTDNNAQSTLLWIYLLSTRYLCRHTNSATQFSGRQGMFLNIFGVKDGIAHFRK